MANYTKTSIGNEGRIELHEKLKLTGAEVSINRLPAGAGVPFVHAHKNNEEIYGVISGEGKAMIDGEEIHLVSGDWLKIESVKPELLGEHPLLIYNEDFALSRQLMTLFNQHNVKPRIAVRSGQWDFLAAMVQAGVGIAILPQPICERLDKNTLRWIPLESDLHWQLGMIWREGVYLSHSAQAWLECCKGFWVQSE